MTLGQNIRQGIQILCDGFDSRRTRYNPRKQRTHPSRLPEKSRRVLYPSYKAMLKEKEELTKKVSSFLFMP
jgi:hypothetical protein